MKWYNFETRWISLRDILRAYLKENGIRYELSGGPGFYHFEIYTDPAGAAALDKVIEKECIWEV